MSFFGSYTHTVDTKGRVSLPAKFRKALPEKLVMVPWMGEKLMVFTEETFDEWVTRFFEKDENGEAKYNPRSTKDSEFVSFVYSNAEDCAVDAAGRITVSPKLRGFAKINESADIKGCGDHLEIVTGTKPSDPEEFVAFLSGFMEP